MKYLKTYEKYQISSNRVYCIWASSKKNKSFTIGKYYTVYLQNTSNWGESMKIINDNDKTVKLTKMYPQEYEYYYNVYKIPHFDIIPFYRRIGSAGVFIKETDIEIYNTLITANKYNL